MQHARKPTSRTPTDRRSLHTQGTNNKELLGAISGKVSRRPLIDSRHVGCYRRPWERLAALTSSLGGSSFPLACQWVAQYSTLLCNSSTPTWTMLLVSLKLPEEENIEDEATHRTGSRQQACRNRGKTNKTAGHCSTAAPTHPHTIDLLPMQHCLIAEH